jgi:hypothetical protein
MQHTQKISTNALTIIKVLTTLSLLFLIFRDYIFSSRVNDIIDEIGYGYIVLLTFVFWFILYLAFSINIKGYYEKTYTKSFWTKYLALLAFIVFLYLLSLLDSTNVLNTL